MATTFTIADDVVKGLLVELMQAYHPNLDEAKVRVGILFAWNDDGPAVKSGGYPAAACLKIVSLKDRITKGYDAELLIDGSLYESDLQPEQRAALIDHELTHLRRVPNTPLEIKGGGCLWKTDDIGRPKLKLVNGDWNVGDGFASVVARHGDNAVEFLNIKNAHLRALTAKRKGEEEREAEREKEPE